MMQITFFISSDQQFRLIARINNGKKIVIMVKDVTDRHPDDVLLFMRKKREEISVFFCWYFNCLFMFGIQKGEVDKARAEDARVQALRLCVYVQRILSNADFLATTEIAEVGV